MLRTELLALLLGARSSTFDPHSTGAPLELPDLLRVFLPPTVRTAQGAVKDLGNAPFGSESFRG